MEDIYEKVLWEGYGLRLHGTVRTRTGLVCKTDKGMRELKKARGRTQNICFAHDVKECLYQNGFTAISRFYQSKEGQPYFIKDGILFVLEELLPTIALEENTAEAFIRGAETLGRLHSCGKGIRSSHSAWDKERLPRQFSKRRIELMKIKRRIQRQGSYDAIDLLVMGFCDAYIEQTTVAEELLGRADYYAQAEKGEDDGVFCHHSYKGENLRAGTDDRLYIGGFEGCNSDLPILDLAAYLKRYMKKTDGAESGAMEMLAAYESGRPLEEKERILLKALVMYPEKLLRLTNEYYNKRRTCVSPAMQERLQAAVAEEEKTKALHAYLRTF